MYILFYAIILFFALQGMMQICMVLITKYNKKELAARLHSVMTVKDEQDTIECIIREIAWSQFTYGQGKVTNDLVVVDLGSTDDTYTILKKLEDEYDFLYVCTKMEYITGLGES